MSAEAKIREALAAGPTSGPWIGAGPSFGDPLPRYTTEIMTERDEAEECETVCSFPFLHHDAENEANAQLMAACNPAAMAELLAELDSLRAEMTGVREALLAALKFHPSASHVSPDFRDLFNKTLQQHFDRYREYAARNPKEPGHG